MNVVPTRLPGVLLVEPRAFGDERGYFFESWSAARYEAAGIPPAFVQDNISYSRRGILRGLHLQNPHAQGKLVSVLRGEVFDVVVDVRTGSPTFGQWVGVLLSATNHRQLWVPEGFAHGFCVTGDEALFHYKCTDGYHPECEMALRWNDPAIGIQWPLEAPALNAKDAGAPTLAELTDSGRLPAFQG